MPAATVRLRQAVHRLQTPTHRVSLFLRQELMVAVAVAEKAVAVAAAVQDRQTRVRVTVTAVQVAMAAVRVAAAAAVLGVAVAVVAHLVFLHGQMGPGPIFMTVLRR